MLLMIDNYDSFTYTLVNYFESLDQEVVVKRNDEISIAEINALNPTQIVISPGPCSPNEAGISESVIKHFYSSTPILGVCLGHQVIAQHFGANVIKAPRIMHGKTSTLIHNGLSVFKDLPSPLTVTRYHSLIVDASTLPENVLATAWVKDPNYSESENELMGLCVKDYPVMGVQFHPESVMSEYGLKMLNNFLQTS